ARGREERRGDAALARSRRSSRCGRAERPPPAVSDGRRGVDRAQRWRAPRRQRRRRVPRPVGDRAHRARRRVAAQAVPPDRPQAVEPGKVTAENAENAELLFLSNARSLLCTMHRRTLRQPSNSWIEKEHSLRSLRAPRLLVVGDHSVTADRDRSVIGKRAIDSAVSAHSAVCFYSAVHAVGRHFAPSRSFLKCELVTNGSSRNVGSSTMVVTVNHWSPFGSACRSRYSVTVAFSLDRKSTRLNSSHT